MNYCRLWVGFKWLLGWAVFSSLSIHQVVASSGADEVFASLRDSVFQIRIIERKSGSQAALGTGFLIEDNVIATNYHVVSSDVLQPEKYRIELEVQGQSYSLSVLTVDVVNDLALLVGEELPELGTPFVLAQTPPNQGALLYSLGNPHNLGLTIVQGNYNGLVQHKFLDRIHYSGAINSGMSGGPTVDNQYQVVGINVASAGNQVGFLVPVAALQELKQKSLDLPPNYQILDDMAGQIARLTDAMLEDLLAAPWPVEPMGNAKILGKTVDWFDCWGNSNEDKDTGRLNISRGCNNADRIFLNHAFNTGFFEYEYHYFEAPDWPSASFYRFLRADTAGAVPGNDAGKDDVGNYLCKDAHVASASGEEQIVRRVSYCVRPYKKLKGLYDVFFIGVSEDKERQAIMDHFTLSGVTESSSRQFLQRFIEVVTWQ